MKTRSGIAAVLLPFLLAVCRIDDAVAPSIQPGPGAGKAGTSQTVAGPSAPAAEQEMQRPDAANGLALVLAILLLCLITTLLCSEAVGFPLPRQADVAAPGERGRAVRMEGRLSRLESGLSAKAAELEDLRARCSTLEAAVQRLAPLASEGDSRLAATTGRLDTPEPDQAKLSRQVEALSRNVQALFVGFQKLVRQENRAPQGAALPLERDVLSAGWKKFQDNRDLMVLVENAARDERWREIRDPLLLELPQGIPEDLRPTFDTVLAPVRDFHNLVTKISLVPRLVNDELPRLPSEAQELMRLREFINLLTMTQNSNLVADRLNFRLERWVVDHFLGFADLFLQRYQQAEMQRQEDHLQPALRIVRRILKVADLEPLELTLGQTPFDSTRHVGRSTASDPNFASGIIVGVVRNGFLRGQQVVRQPEVIVNRVG